MKLIWGEISDSGQQVELPLPNLPSLGKNNSTAEEKPVQNEHNPKCLCIDFPVLPPLLPTQVLSLTACEWALPLEVPGGEPTLFGWAESFDTWG